MTNIRMKEAILRAGTKQNRLALDCRIEETRLSRIVNGWIRPKLDEKRAIASALGVTIMELWPGTEYVVDATGAITATWTVDALGNPVLWQIPK